MVHNRLKFAVARHDAWNLLIDLMNHSTSSRTVYLQVRYTLRPRWESVKRVRPVWLDIDQCGDSEYSIPAGFSDTHRDRNVNRSMYQSPHPADDVMGIMLAYVNPQ